MTSHKFISTVLNEWQQNQRFRVGGWAILIILMAYLILLLSDKDASLRADYQDATGRLGRLELLVRQKEWIGRADAVRSVIVQMEGRFWKASTRGLAQAKLQMWVDNLLKNKGISDVRTQIDPAREMTEYDGIWQVAAKMEGTFEPHKLMALLRSMETSQEIVTVEQLDIVNNGKHPRFVLAIRAYFQANPA